MRKIWLRAVLLAGGALTVATAGATKLSAPAGVKPPVAAKKPYAVPSPNGSRQDPYYWLRDDTRKSPEMLGYLAAENAYTEAVLAPTRGLQDTLYDEIVARLKQDDSTPPTLHHGYWYYRRYETGK